ncbi:type II toxin-antitoxin system Phd/YefM family antitoxin [Bathymodiolus platifrons methanotrophic gill symbiont]|uniref:type II toxin-antitoxin system Phd/YefM family antitoxin n=1 Tax=Bathymodiolus platifrons methanotrophic gill symbiont TaxID=113268 RepID=UPI00142DE466|nr:type II toxin-antitoxin system Phd/YefM family antitoxin [Bathymodiolus platifrons methanotrophic gill symbiont]
MKTLTSSEARQGFSSLLSTIEVEPVRITKDSKSVAVIITDTRYKELEKIEDFLYAAAADLAIKEGFAPKEEADELLKALTSDK